MQEENLRLLQDGLRLVGGRPGERAAADPARLEALVRHLEEVRTWNERVNLTAITEEREMVIKHTLDSAALVGFAGLNSGERVLDVGTGAGFPGVVVKLLQPDVRLSLLDSLQKRCRFLEHLATLFWPEAAEGVEVLWGRAEEWGQRRGYREGFDLVVARAVAPMRVLAEYCLPFARLGGRFIAMKGPGIQGELEEARQALAVLGGEVAGVQTVELPGGMGERVLVEVRKERPTPAAYPRRAGTPERKPL